MAYPCRVTVGLEQNRLTFLLTVLPHHDGAQMTGQGVFVNLVSGIKVTENNADLALLLALVTSLPDKPLPSQWMIFSDVGLSGRIRPISGGQERITEAAKYEF